MALKRSKSNPDKDQLDLFTYSGGDHDRNNTDAVRIDGGETLARVSPQHGARNGRQGYSSSDAAGSTGENRRRTGEDLATTESRRHSSRSGIQNGVGNSQGEI